MFGVQSTSRRKATTAAPKATLLGLDIGSYSLKSVRIARSKSGIRLDQVRIMPFERPLTSNDANGSLDRIASALEEARLGGSRWKPIPVACTIPYCMGQMRLLDARPGNEGQSDELILRELAAEDTNGEEAWVGDYWQTHSTVGADESTPVGIVGARRVFVEELITCLETLGFEPRVIDGAPFAIARALRRSEGRHDEVSAALDLGYEGAFFVVVRRGTPFYFRVLRGCGTRGVAEAIAHGLNIDERAAHQFLKACCHAARRPSTASKTMVNTLRELATLPLRRLQNELARTLDFARRQADCGVLKRITLFGGGALLPGMASLLENWADLEFRAWNIPLDELSETHAESLPLLAQALALAEIATHA